MRNPLKPLYYFLTKFCETSLVSLFAGIASGIAINIATSQDIPAKGLIAIGLFLFAVISLVVLNRIRQRIDNGYVDLVERTMSDEVRWRTAADFKNGRRVVTFFLFFLFSLSSFGLGIAFIYAANKDASGHANLAGRIDLLKADSIVTHKINDSLISVLTTKMEFKPDSRTKAKRRQAGDKN